MNPLLFGFDVMCLGFYYQEKNNIRNLLMHFTIKLWSKMFSLFFFSYLILNIFPAFPFQPLFLLQYSSWRFFLPKKRYFLFLGRFLADSFTWIHTGVYSWEGSCLLAHFFPSFLMPCFQFYFRRLFVCGNIWIYPEILPKNKNKEIIIIKPKFQRRMFI